MLRSNDIMHLGLQEVYQTGFTRHAAPPAHEHRACYRRLFALNVARSVQDANMAPFAITPAPTAHVSDYSLLLKAGRIVFNWTGGYARSVDWRR